METTIATIRDPRQWNDLVTALPCSHLLQSWEWGELKEKYGWQAERLCWRDANGKPYAAVQLLKRRLRISGLRSSPQLLYCPKGPLLDWADRQLAVSVLATLQARATQRGVILIKIDPDLPLGYGYPGEPDFEQHAAGQAAASLLREQGWRESAVEVQFRNTMILDLRQSEQELLEGLKQKTRYNIRLASRKGVTVRPVGKESLPLFYRMYAETSVRDQFVIRDPAYYQDAWESFVQAGLAQPLLAEVEDEPVAGMIVYRFGATAWFLYGMSLDQHREWMPSYLLQWEAIRWAKMQGCTNYDFWGAPDLPEPGDPLWGVYRFKRGWGARVVRTLGAWDFTARPGFYWLYSIALPRVLAWMRMRGRARTRNLLE